MKSFLKRAYTALDIWLPGALAVVLIAKYGLLWVFAVASLECIQLLIAKHFMKNAGGNHDLLKAVLTSAGISAGASLFYVKASPAALGAAAILVVVVHFAVYLIMASFIRR